MVAGPNKALVFSGGCCGGSRARTIRIGGGGCRWWCCTIVDKLDLTIMTLFPSIEQAETKEGVAVAVSGVVQVKISTSENPETSNKYASVELAAEMFSGKSASDIKETLLATIDGHLRAIIGTMEVIDIYQNRELFQEKVLDVACKDLLLMGMEIKSFTLKDITDKNGYLDSLGKSRTAQVKRDAEVGKALALAAANEVQVTCERELKDVSATLDANIDRYKTELSLKKAAFDQETNLLRANAEQAITKANEELQKELTTAKYEAEIAERNRSVELEALEADRKKQELIATVDRLADAEKFKIETQGLMRKEIALARAQGKAQAIRLKGDAESSKIQAIGEAKADVIVADGEAYKQYGEAALGKMIIEALPKYAAEVAAPLGKTGDVTIISGDNKATEKMANIVGTMPPAVEALTGVDITKAMEKMMKK